MPEDDPDAPARQHGVRGEHWQSLLTVRGMVAVINSVIVAVLAALIAGRFLHALWSRS